MRKGERKGRERVTSSELLIYVQFTSYSSRKYIPAVIKNKLSPISKISVLISAIVSKFANLTLLSNRKENLLPTFSLFIGKFLKKSININLILVFTMKRLFEAKNKLAVTILTWNSHYTKNEIIH